MMLLVSIDGKTLTTAPLKPSDVMVKCANCEHVEEVGAPGTWVHLGRFGLLMPWCPACFARRTGTRVPW